jgi:hypothetical protein
MRLLASTLLFALLTISGCESHEQAQKEESLVVTDTVPETPMVNEVTEMKPIPNTDDTPVMRTDFSNRAAWEAICKAVQKPSPEGFEADVTFIDDRAFEGMTKQQLLASIPNDYPHTFIIIVDQKAITEAEHPLLIVNLYGDPSADPGAEFRAVPSVIQDIQNNLSIANMDFVDFSGAVDGGGVFRGFR